MVDETSIEVVNCESDSQQNLSFTPEFETGPIWPNSQNVIQPIWNAFTIPAAPTTSFGSFGEFIQQILEYSANKKFSGSETSHSPRRNGGFFGNLGPNRRLNLD